MCTIIIYILFTKFNNNHGSFNKKILYWHNLKKFNTHILKENYNDLPELGTYRRGFDRIAEVRSEDERHVT